MNRRQNSRWRLAAVLTTAVALAAFFFSAYLLYIQLDVIDAVCQWCLASDIITTAIAAFALLRLRLAPAPTPRPAPARPYPKRRPDGHRKRTADRRVRGC